MFMMKYCLHFASSAISKAFLASQGQTFDSLGWTGFLAFFRLTLVFLPSKINENVKTFI